MEAARPPPTEYQGYNNVVFIVLASAAGVCFVLTAQQLFLAANLPVMIITYAVLFATGVVIVSTRLYTTRNALADIPKEYVPILQYHVSPDMHKVINDGLVRAIGLGLVVRPPIESCQQPGWGAPGSDMDLVRFKTSVGLLHLIVEKAAVERDPSWERQEHQSVREYLQSLAERLPLDRVAVDVYADLYEKARFSEEELTLDEYSVAMNAFVTLMQVFAPEAAT